MKQFLERGMDKAGIKLIGTGDVTDDDQLNDMGDGAIGVVTSHHYSAYHPSAMNKKFVAEFGKANVLYDVVRSHDGALLDPVLAGQIALKCPPDNQGKQQARGPR